MVDIASTIFLFAVSVLFHHNLATIVQVDALSSWHAVKLASVQVVPDAFRLVCVSWY